MRPERRLERRLAQDLLAGHPDDAARALEALPDDDVVAVLGESAPPVAAEVLRRVASHRAAAVLGRLPDELARDVLERLGPEPSAHILRRMDDERRRVLLEGMKEAFARPLASMLQFREGTAGSIMDPHVLALAEDLTVQEANRRIREEPAGVRYNLYVVDRNHRLVGVLTLRELLLAERNDRLANIANREVLSIRADADRRAVLLHPAWREVHCLPVVDESGVYLGAVRYRTLRLLEDEARRRAAGEVTTGQALGELFWAGFAGAAGSIAAAVARPGNEPE